MSVKNFILILFLISIYFIGCNNDDENPIQIYSISGDWQLQHISGGFTSTNLTFEPEEIIWSFNTNSNILTVQNNLDSDSNISYESGTYGFRIEEDGDARTLYIEEVRQGSIRIQQDTLIIDNNYADGYLYQFVR